MTVTIERSRANGAVKAPPSKSAAHRALICAALSEKCRVENLAASDDILATLGCLRALGAKVIFENGTATLGGLDPFGVTEAELDCRESGSTLRFLIPLCMLGGGRVTFRGTERLFARNLDIYADIAKEQGIFFKTTENSLTVQGRLRAGNYKLPGNISSQFISGLLFALPLLRDDSIIEIKGRFESAPYAEMTAYFLSLAGANIEKRENLYTIRGGAEYHMPDTVVEGDCSNAAFLEAFNLLGGNVDVTGLSGGEHQGDRVYKELFAALKNGEKHFDLADVPDLAPVMFALAPLFGGAEFSGTGRLKIKESDRAEAMRAELEKFGVAVAVRENSVKVGAATLKAPDGDLCGHNDHRIVMALSLLCSVTGGSITGAEAVKKSFPDFFGKIKELGIAVKQK